MARFVSGIGLLMAALMLSGCTAPQKAHIGRDMSIDDKPVTVTELVAHPQKYGGEKVLVKGRITSLCTHSGCWMEIADDDAEEGLFVKFVFDADQGRVPAEAMGHWATCEGTLVVTELTDEQRRHYAEEQGKTMAEIDRHQMQLACVAAEVEGVERWQNVPACQHR